MRLLIWILTAVVVLDCGLLMLLILIQLPKKDAGMGTAFGGGATDALFGAGSGNVLTKLTKYSSGIFLGLALLLSVLIVRQSHEKGRGLEQELQKKAASPMGVPATFPPASSKPSMVTSNLLITTNLLTPMAPEATNPLPKASNAAKPPPAAPVPAPTK